MKTRKFVALVNLMVFVSSLISPAFADDVDMREEKLNQREKMLTQRAVLISEQSVNLDDREQALNRRGAELEELSKVINSRNVEFSVREIELDELKASLKKDTVLLASQTKEFNKDREAFAVYKAEVENKAKEADTMARNAADKLKAAEERNLQAAKLEKSLVEREEKFTARLNEIEIANADLLLLDKKTQEDMKEADEKIAMLDKQKNDIEAARSALDKQRAELEAKKTDLEALKEETDRIMSEAKVLKAEADEKTRKADEIIRLNEEQKEIIAKLAADLAEKENEIKALFIPKEHGALFAELNSDIPANSSVTATDKGVINWSDGSIRAKGMGVAPAYGNEAQGMALARWAAIVDLQRNLLETIQGVQIDSQTKVEDFMAKDTVNSAVKGTVNGVEVIDESWDSKLRVYTVFGQVRQEKLSGAMSLIRESMRPEKLPKEPGKKTGKYTGLILDARHLSLTQQKFFRIVDEKGVLVYGASCADKNVQDKQGLCTYFDNIVLKADEHDKVGDNPLVIKAQRFASNGTDIVIPTPEAEKIRSNSINFRKDCRVIIVRS